MSITNPDSQCQTLLPLAACASCSSSILRSIDPQYLPGSRHSLSLSLPPFSLSRPPRLQTRACASKLTGTRLKCWRTQHHAQDHASTLRAQQQCHPGDKVSLPKKKSLESRTRGGSPTRRGGRRIGRNIMGREEKGRCGLHIQD